MDKTEALKAIRTLVKIALDSGDIEAVQKLLREMENIIKKALPPRPHS